MTQALDFREKVFGGLWGAVVGDALGVPVEFSSREARRLNPVVDMQGYGTYKQPAGTWSDDSSMMLCLIESLSNGFDTARMAQLFVQWLNRNYWTPWGVVFDHGKATADAIQNLASGVSPEVAGVTGDYENGNGSLMRILPIAFYFSKAPTAELLNYAHRASSITHRQLRSQMACGFYCAFAVALLEGQAPQEAYTRAIQKCLPVYNRPPFQAEMPNFERIFGGKIGELPESKIRSEGYVIYTLEASLWCLLNSKSYKEAVLKAVNLGKDTDTTGIVTGGIAGIYYGLKQVPEEWINILAKKADIEKLFDAFLAGLNREAQT